MNYDDNSVRQDYEAFKRRLIKIGIVVILIMVVANITILSAYKSGLKQEIANNLTTEVIDDVQNTVSDRVTTNLTSEVLSQYTRQYKLRDEDVSVGSYVASNNLYAVVDIVCTGRQVAGGSIVGGEIQYSYTSIGSTATGMVINSDGYVLTNAHVVVHSDYVGTIVSTFGRNIINYEAIEKVYTTISATFYGSDVKYELSVVAYDTSLDLAVLKFVTLPDSFTEEGFDDFVTFGDSDTLELGEAAVVIGNAYDLGISVTTGTITNTHPDLSAYDVGKIYSDGDIIQTDTAINSGNSGGPMFDSTACCIGVASFKISTGTTEGLGFAIASNLAVKYINSVAESKGLSITITTFYGAERLTNIISA